MTNEAALFGGGIALGNVGGGSEATCAARLVDGTSLVANSAAHAAAQLYMACSSDLYVSATQFVLTTNATQVVAPLAGNVTFAAQVRLLCSTGASFVDSFKGLYGIDGAYLVESAYCVGHPNNILMSTLSFECEACGAGRYSVVGGASNGEPGQATAVVPCLPCPVGGLCPSGSSVLAAPGHWGAVSIMDATVQFMVCPTGYCCDGSPSSPCLHVSSCGGGREGAACSECSSASGFVEALGTSRCQSTSRCRTDQAMVWSLVVVVVAVAAVLQLTVVSAVWVTPKSLPSGEMKLAIYFAQMSSYVGIEEVRSSGTEDVLLSLLRMQAPSHSSTGFCILRGLTATSKVALDVGLQLGVGVAMLALVLLGRVLTKLRWPTRGSPARSCARQGHPRGLQPRDPQFTVPMEGAYTTLLDATSAPRASSAFGLESGPAESTPVPGPLSSRARYTTAAVNFGLTMYANVTLGVIKMMHCVWVPGTPRHTRHLFIRATQQCDYSGWQLPYAAVLVVLVLAPVVLVIAALWSRGRVPEYLVTLEQGQPSRPSAWSLDLRLGLRRAAVDCYVQQRPWWEAVLVLQRLVIALVFAFGSSYPGLQTLLQTSLCILFLATHLIERPLQNPEAHWLQTLLLFCLALVSLSASPTAMALDEAASSGGSAASFAPVMRRMFGAVVPVASLAWAFGGARVRALVARWRGR